MSESTIRPDQDAARKPYEKPRLNTWGDLRTITAGGGGKNADSHPTHGPFTKI